MLHCARSKKKTLCTVSVVGIRRCSYYEIIYFNVSDSRVADCCEGLSVNRSHGIVAVSRNALTNFPLPDIIKSIREKKSAIDDGRSEQPDDHRDQAE